MPGERMTCRLAVSSTVRPAGVMNEPVTLNVRPADRLIERTSCLQADGQADRLKA